MPATKKPLGTRASHAKASTRATLRQLDPDEIQIPDLPEDRDWHPHVVEWWRDVWSSPMAAEYLDVDRSGLEALAVLENDFWQADRPNLRKDVAAEIRLQRKDYGLTPYDRRRLEWSIESAEDAKDRGAARRTRQGTVPPSAANDPRRGLHSA